MTVFVTALHDPKAKLKKLSDQHVKDLLQIFDKVILSASKQTNRQYLNTLNKQGCNIVSRTNSSIARAYYTAIKKGYASNAKKIFYCDFDRILHWVHFFPKELKKVTKINCNYLVCERRPQDYKKHHQALYETEIISNKIISKALGEKKYHDYLSGCFVYSRAATKVVLKSGVKKGMQHYGVWPIKLAAAGIKPKYIYCKGLEWETPDRFKKEIKKAGGIRKWRENLSNSTEWQRRVRWAREFVEDII
jgi:hypothetical protein